MQRRFFRGEITFRYQSTHPRSYPQEERNAPIITLSCPSSLFTFSSTRTASDWGSICRVPNIQRTPNPQTLTSQARLTLYRIIAPRLNLPTSSTSFRSAAAVWRHGVVYKRAFRLKTGWDDVRGRGTGSWHVTRALAGFHSI